MRRDRSTRPLFGDHRDIGEQVAGYLRDKGWFVHNQRARFIKDLNGKYQVVGDPDALHWRASYPMVQGVALEFYFHAQLRVTEKDKLRRDWMAKQAGNGYLCAWFTSVDQALAWYHDTFPWLTGVDRIRTVKEALARALPHPELEEREA